MPARTSRSRTTTQNPERYRSRFTDYLPQLTALVNCIYWTPRYPRLVTRAAARRLWSAGERALRVIGDISCDIGGSIEITYKATEPDQASLRLRSHRRRPTRTASRGAASR